MRGKDKYIVCIALMKCTITSTNITQRIQSLLQQSAVAETGRRQKSAWPPLPHIPLTLNHILNFVLVPVNCFFFPLSNPLEIILVKYLRRLRR